LATRHPWRTFGTVALVPLLATSAGAAQIPSFSARSDLVVLSATAVNGKGRPIRDLQSKEFRIFEDGRPQKVEHFTRSTDVPARILLLVDASGSMNVEDKTASGRMAAIQIMASLSPEDEVALAGFDHKYWGIVRFTRNRDEIKKGLDDVEPFGSTALHDALDHAARDLASHGEGRRAVVVITDGVDTASQSQAEDVIQRSRALDVPIYAISILSPLDDPTSSLYTGRQRPAAATAGLRLLERYAEESGGAAFAVSDFPGLKAASDQISDELKHQYRIGYVPLESGNRFRKILVKSTRKGVVIRTRSGYVPRS
jgi:Ca-activated chloride channel family protein